MSIESEADMWKVVVLVVSAVLSGCGEAQKPISEMTGQEREEHQENMRKSRAAAVQKFVRDHVLRDPETGCEYIKIHRNLEFGYVAITPRLTKHGILGKGCRGGR